RRTMLCSAGKIFLYARSPVAPKNTSASETGGFVVADADAVSGAIATLLRLPESDPSEQSLEVRDDLDPRGKGGLDPLGIAAADVEAVVGERVRERLDRPADSPVPLLLARLPPRGISELVLVRPAPPGRVVGELDVRHEVPVGEERGTKAGPQR